MPLAEHDNAKLPPNWSKKVSIHVPLAEHDNRLRFPKDFIVVSIHVPLAEHDLLSFFCCPK